MITRGRSAFHVDLAAALKRDGRLVAAAEEGWFMRVQRASLTLLLNT
ncbi:MAG: hypothetical protein ACLQUZ_06660 [Rhizomicrobium sp.]